MTVWAEAGLWSCVGDLARWISFQFSDDSPVLASSSLKEMHTARYLGNEEWTEAWGSSWYAARKDGVTWVQQSGGMHGFITNICFDPKERVGAIALLNGIKEANELSMELGAMARAAAVAAAPAIEAAVPTPDASTGLSPGDSTTRGALSPPVTSGPRRAAPSRAPKRRAAAT